VDELIRSAPSLANWRRRPSGDGMVPLSELARNPVALTVSDDGEERSLSAERGASGKVWLTCSCASSTAEGWCNHRIDLLCLRYGATVGTSAASKQAFEQIVTGTALGHAGRSADRALKAFADCLAAFDAQRPANVAGRNLGKFTDLVSDLAACASELEDALGTLRRLLERD